MKQYNIFIYISLNQLSNLAGVWAQRLTQIMTLIYILRGPDDLVILAVSFHTFFMTHIYLTNNNLQTGF